MESINNNNNKPRQCLDCQYYLSDALALEEEIKGLTIVSSALGAVRADTGLCRYRDKFVVAKGCCDHFIG